MAGYDPEGFGSLRTEVRHLQTAVEKLSVQVSELTALANRSKGAFWAAIALSGVVGSAITFVLSKLGVGGLFR